MRRRRLIAAFVLFFLVAGSALTYRFGRALWHPAWVRVRGERTVEQVLAARAPGERIGRRLSGAGLALPPTRVALVALKAERRLELWAAGDAGDWQLVHVYAILAASGHAGPKLREGDRQVPEGIYRIEALNPNSRYHLSLRLNYPNEFDLARAREDGRTDPGGDIYIHGKAASIGCLAIGDEAIEELFHLVGTMWPAEVKVIIAPTNLRSSWQSSHRPDSPEWVEGLYDMLRSELRAFEPSD